MTSASSQANTTLTAVRGTIKRYSGSGSGLVLNEREQWFNFSKYGQELPRPAPGTPVELLVDEKNYLKNLTVLSAPTTPMPEQQVIAAAHDDSDGRLSQLLGIAPIATSPELRYLADPADPADREKRIIRQSVLKVVAELYSGALSDKPDLLGELLSTAEVLEGWVLR